MSHSILALLSAVTLVADAAVVDTATVHTLATLEIDPAGDLVQSFLSNSTQLITVGTRATQKISAHRLLSRTVEINLCQARVRLLNESHRRPKVFLTTGDNSG